MSQNERLFECGIYVAVIINVQPSNSCYHMPVKISSKELYSYAAASIRLEVTNATRVLTGQAR